MVPDFCGAQGLDLPPEWVIPEEFPLWPPVDEEPHGEQGFDGPQGFCAALAAGTIPLSAATGKEAGKVPPAARSIAERPPAIARDLRVL